MERLQLNHNITVMGFQVKTFPDRIGEAFNSLIQKIPDGPDRPCYGISYVADDKIVYLAAIAEKTKGEATKYGYENYTIRKGEYQTTTVHDWLSKTATIKDVFQAMLPDKCPTREMPCIEWYKSNEEMLCMVPL